jgi:hypothetical protein
MKIILLAALLCLISLAASAQQPFSFTQMGYQQIVGPAAATNLTVPQGAKIIQVCVSTQAIRYRDDGVAPTSTVGIPVSAGTCFQYSGPLPLIQFIQQAATATIDVSYYR